MKNLLEVSKTKPRNSKGIIMKIMNRLMLTAVVMGCVMSTANLQAMRKRNEPKPLLNNQQKKQMVETNDHKQITATCGDIKQGVESKKITPSLFLTAATKIAEALKKLKQEEPETCITIKDVVKAFFNHFISASILNGEGEQQTQNINQFYSLGEQLIGVEADDNQQESEENQAPIFYGDYANYNQIIKLLQEIFNTLCQRVEKISDVLNFEKESVELEQRTKQARKRLDEALERNDVAENKIRDGKQTFQELAQRVSNVEAELTLQAENAEEQAVDNELVALKVENMNHKMIQKEKELKKLLNN